ncbi:Hypothetical predicted protein [Pelobates cultripes]|uniref:Uncharacterized protein n=1 Tax=Pelobates cultripes TaxID=61616 RepID=A0AAD1S528_PELCU|nr:Hypothetical predicted protein [Pelobates cultripes]
MQIAQTKPQTQLLKGEWSHEHKERSEAPWKHLKAKWQHVSEMRPAILIIRCSKHQLATRTTHTHQHPKQTPWDPRPRTGVRHPNIQDRARGRVAWKSTKSTPLLQESQKSTQHGKIHLRASPGKTEDPTLNQPVTHRMAAHTETESRDWYGAQNCEKPQPHIWTFLLKYFSSYTQSKENSHNHRSLSLR